MKRNILVFMLVVVMTVTLIPSISMAATDISEEQSYLTEQEEELPEGEVPPGADTDLTTENTGGRSGADGEKNKPEENIDLEEYEEHLNYKPVEVDYNVIETKSNDRRMARMMTDVERQPSYDSRQQSWYKANYIKVKNQNPTGTCWAFAMTTCAEISYLKESGGKPVDELSPTHLAYFTSNHVEDPLGGTQGDVNWFNGSWDQAGGSFYFGAPTLSGWVGAATEAKAPFSERRSGYASSLAYDDYLTAEGINIIPPDEGNDKKTDEEINTEFIDKIKNEIQNRGAAGLGVNWQSEHLNTSNHAYYYGNEGISNHAVTAVGWDDNFDKNQFNSYEDSEGVVHSPENDGAFIIQNSWGSNVGGHDKGYFYLSYESVRPEGAVAASVDMEPANAKEMIFQYDGTASTGNIGVSKGKKVGNVFTVPSDENIYLDSVGFYQYNEGTATYDIDIYSGLKSDTDPESGTKATASPLTVTTTNIGYNKFKLPKKINLVAGTKYSIVITMKNDTYFGADKKVGTDKTWYRFTPKNNPKQSFFSSSDGKWYDLYNSGACARIKAYASYTSGKEPIYKYKYGAQLDTDKYVYDGTEKTPGVTVDGLKKGVDYQVSYENNINAGTAKALIKGIGNYQGTIVLKYTIEGIDISKYKNVARLSATNYVYNGSKRTPEVTVDGLEKDVDYQVSYENNVNAGTARVLIKGIGDYYGTIVLNYTIGKAYQTIQVPRVFEARKGVYVSLNAKGAGTLRYATANKKIAKVTASGRVKGMKYKSTTITVTASGNGNYYPASVKVPVKVYRNLNKAKLKKTKFKYTGRTIVPKIKSVNGSRKYKEGSSYRVIRPATSINRGTYRITIIGIGKYRGTVTKIYKIY